MIRRKKFWRSHKVYPVSFKKNQFVTLMCIGLIVIVAFTMMDIQLASAEITEKTLYKTPEYPVAPVNVTEIQYCDVCHADDMPNTWILVTVDSQTPGDITYYVTGSDTFDGEEGWAVFDPLENNKANGHNSGYFTLPKDSQTYRVFWVDNGTGGTGEAGGGTAYEDIIPLNDAPSTPTIDGPTSGEPGTSYSYNFVSTDENEDDISYYIKWGDGSTTDWTAFQASGTPYSESHTWSETGTYTIEAKARDTPAGAESDWGTLAVQIISEPGLKIRLKVVSIGRVCANIENVGAGSLSDINWNISVEGGLFRLIKRINANGNGTIETLGAGEKQVVCTPEKSIILRFGIAKVTVTATIGEKTFTHNQFVLVTGQLIFARLLLFRK